MPNTSLPPASNTAYVQTLTVPDDWQVSNLQDSNIAISRINDTGTLAVTAGSGAGTAPTITLDSNANALRGMITVTTGSSPAADGVIGTFAFPSPFAAPPYVLISPANSNAASAEVSAVATDASFTLTSAAGSALMDATEYQWTYFVQG